MGRAEATQHGCRKVPSNAPGFLVLWNSSLQYAQVWGLLLKVRSGP